MRELDRRIATLRLRLAEIGSRQERLKGLERQFRNQLDKVMDFAVYEKGDLDSALSMADEVDVRLSQTERALHHLETIRARGQEELEALLLTRNIEAARTELAALEAQRLELEATMERAGDPEVAQPGSNGGGERRAELESQQARIDAQIRQLRRIISQASDEAARAVSARRRE